MVPCIKVVPHTLRLQALQQHEPQQQQAPAAATAQQPPLQLPTLLHAVSHWLDEHQGQEPTERIHAAARWRNRCLRALLSASAHAMQAEAQNIASGAQAAWRQTHQAAGTSQAARGPAASAMQTSGLGGDAVVAIAATAMAALGVWLPIECWKPLEAAGLGQEPDVLLPGGSSASCSAVQGSALLHSNRTLQHSNAPRRGRPLQHSTEQQLLARSRAAQQLQLLLMQLHLERALVPGLLRLLQPDAGHDCQSAAPYSDGRADPMAEERRVALYRLASAFAVKGQPCHVVQYAGIQDVSARP